jgi:hypothetical protein
VATRPAARSALFGEQWWESYGRLSPDRQSSCDRAVMALIKGMQSAGLNVKPILPEKHYLEARISSGDRIVFRVDAGTIAFLDVVSHDEIGRYGRRSRPPR